MEELENLIVLSLLVCFVFFLFLSFKHYREIKESRFKNNDPESYKLSKEFASKNNKTNLTIKVNKNLTAKLVNDNDLKKNAKSEENIEEMDEFKIRKMLDDLSDKKEKDRIEYFKNYKIPLYIKERFLNDFDYLEEDYEDIEKALMDYFSLFLPKEHNGLIFDFPSQVVDDLWHTFILYTKDYRDFCENSFGRFIDHIPHNSGVTTNVENSTFLINTYTKLKDENKLDIFKFDKKYNKNNYVTTEDMEDILKESKRRYDESMNSSNLTNIALVAAVVAGINNNNTINDSYVADSNRKDTTTGCGGIVYTPPVTSGCGGSSSSSSGCGGGCGGG